MEDVSCGNCREVVVYPCCSPPDSTNMVLAFYLLTSHGSKWNVCFLVAICLAHEQSCTSVLQQRRNLFSKTNTMALLFLSSLCPGLWFSKWGWVGYSTNLRSPCVTKLDEMGLEHRMSHRSVTQQAFALGQSRQGHSVSGNTRRKPKVADQHNPSQQHITLCWEV